LEAASGAASSEPSKTKLVISRALVILLMDEVFGKSLTDLH
jgi:hypothetical protein